MDPALVGVFGFFVLLLLIILEVPVAIALALPGLLGAFYLIGPSATFELFASQAFSYAIRYDFTSVPLFLLMGYTAMHAGVTSAAFDSARVWLNRLPGGLAMATCIASGLTGACIGSGISATVAMARIATPEMLRLNYDKGLAAGCVASASSVAVLIPPSILMVVYAVFSEISLGKLLLAGYIPGLLSIVVFITMIGIRVHLNPNLAPSSLGEVITWKQRLMALRGLWGIALLISVLMGGIYTGFFTATEAAAVGAFVAFVLMMISRNFNWSTLRGSLLEMMQVTAMTFFMLLGSIIFVAFISLTGLPKLMTAWIVAAKMPTFLFLITVAVLYIFLGCFLPAMSTLFVTLPILLPVLIELKINLIWFGIIFMKLAELGGITPPVGLAVYLVKAVLGDSIPIGTIFRGIWWFVILDMLLIVILMAFPEISLWLPSTMRGSG